MNLDAYLVQETWIELNKTVSVRGIIVFHHSVKDCKERRSEKGVNSVLLPKFTKFHEHIGSFPPVVVSHHAMVTKGRRRVEIILKLQVHL